MTTAERIEAGVAAFIFLALLIACLPAGRWADRKGYSLAVGLTIWAAVFLGILVFVGFTTAMGARWE